MDLPISQGASEIPDRATFEVLAARDDVPGALGAREVKFLMLGVEGDKSRLYRLVHFAVTPDGFELESATQAQVDAWLGLLRPAQPQQPRRDLGRREIVDLDQLGTPTPPPSGPKTSYAERCNGCMSISRASTNAKTTTRSPWTSNSRLTTRSSS
jgi:hypothetical protein